MGWDDLTATLSHFVIAAKLTEISRLIAPRSCFKITRCVQCLGKLEALLSDLSREGNNILCCHVINGFLYSSSE